MASHRQSDEQTNRGFVIEEVGDFAKAWPSLEALLLGIIDYHRAWDSRELRPNWAAVMREYMETQCVTLLAERPHGEPLGFLSGTIRSDFGIFEGVVGHVDNAFVVESARRDGIGTLLCECFEAICRSRGGEEVQLDVAIGNVAGDGFWRKSGYTPTMRAMRKALVTAS